MGVRVELATASLTGRDVEIAACRHFAGRYRRIGAPEFRACLGRAGADRLYCPLLASTIEIEIVLQADTYMTA